VAGFRGDGLKGSQMQPLLEVLELSTLLVEIITGFALMSL